MDKHLPHWTDDNFSDEFDYHANNKPVAMDTPLGEAMAFIACREWGRNFDDALASMFHGGPDAFTELRQSAYDGKLTVWGRYNRSDIYRKIPAEHWSAHRIDGNALLLNGFARTTGNDMVSYIDLMVSRAEIEREFRNEKRS